MLYPKVVGCFSNTTKSFSASSLLRSTLIIIGRSIHLLRSSYLRFLGNTLSSTDDYLGLGIGSDVSAKNSPRLSSTYWRWYSSSSSSNISSDGSSTNSVIVCGGENANSFMNSSMMFIKQHVVYRWVF